MEFYTIGVYNSTEQAFFNKLIENKIDIFCDIRQRRGVRGAKYAFVNSARLQNSLNKLKINYKHIKDLAPTQDIRELQKNADIQTGINKRDRNKLGNIFTTAYKDRIVIKFDFNSFIKELGELEISRVVFFCVEEKPEACHRSVVTDYLEKNGYKITHL